MIRRRQRSAFTIVELLVASAVLILGVAEVYAQFVGTRDRSRARLAEAQARALAHQRLEELLACDPAALRAWKSDAKYLPVPGQSRYFWKAEALPAEGGGLTLRAQVGWNPRDAEGQNFPPGQTLVAQGTIPE